MELALGPGSWTQDGVAEIEQGAVLENSLVIGSSQIHKVTAGNCRNPPPAMYGPGTRATPRVDAWVAAVLTLLYRRLTSCPTPDYPHDSSISISISISISSSIIDDDVMM